MQEISRIIIKISCEDKPGILDTITRIIYDNKYNIVQLHQHVEKSTQYFFSRIECELADKSSITQSAISQIHSTLKQKLSPQSSITIKPSKKKNIVIMVSKEYHCLSEIILRCLYDTMPTHILAVIGNHDNHLHELCAFAKIPFHFIPSSDGMTREAHEALVLEQLARYPQLDYIILARYMRILTPHFVEQYSNQIINIHHSFLPAFVGANPYRQAYERGVKLIGATAHFVTDTLDAGPIIAQQVLPITHGLSVKELQSLGRNIEKTTLANAVELVFNDRVFVQNNKTIIL